MFLCTSQVLITSRAGQVGWCPAHRALPEGMDAAWREWRAATDLTLQGNEVPEVDLR